MNIKDNFLQKFRAACPDIDKVRTLLYLS